ncbi:MAG: hypothetical protein RL374_283 [Actinomycetota bacterium]|jgi:hypothetical protein
MSQQKQGARRPSLSSSSTGTLGAAVAVVALVLGFIILNDVRGDGGAATGPVGTADPNATLAPGATIDPAAPTTVPTFSINAFKIQVTNASGVGLSGLDLTTKLQDQGYVVQPATNLAPGAAKRTKTGVFYLAGCEAASQNVAAVLGGKVEVAAMPSPIPTETGSVGEACILILLGTDLAYKPLAGVVGAGSGAAATTTVAPAAG